MSADVRPLAESEFQEWMRTTMTGFLKPPVNTPEDAAQRLKRSDLSRLQGAFDSDTGRCVATFRSFAQRVTVPGGAAVPATAVSGVVVLPTHRRRGLLREMMGRDLAAARARGEVLATLIAAEYPIYGRYGFGPATSLAEWRVEVARTGLDPKWHGPADGGRIDLVDGATVREAGPALHERLCAQQPGVIDRSAHWWEQHTGLQQMSFNSFTEPYYALYRSAAGEVEGLATYRADDSWTDAKVPASTVTVKDLIATTPAAERALWHFLCSIDWVKFVRTGYRAPDDLLPDLFPNPRAAAQITGSDWLWVRILDVVRALEARTYESEGALVLEVADPDGFADGRYRLDVTGGRARCTPTEEAPDLALGVGELSSLYLGDRSAVRLAALGAVAERTQGAAARADALLRTARRPWCPDIF